jgi:putative ABC transport system permease protein
MRLIAKIRLRARSLLQRNRVDRELDEELEDHLERQIEYNVARGMSRSEARFAALRELGPLALRKEECRDARGLALIDSVRQDLSYALRALRKSPGFTAVATLSLAIAIGANATIFTLVNSVLLTPLPYPGANRIVVFHEHKLNSTEPLHVHPVNFVEWRKQARSFEALALAQTPPLNVMGQDGAQQVSRMLATPELFRVFGVRPVLGREFSKDESLPKGGDVVILGYGFWQRWFGGDPAVLGRQLATATGSLTIIGVAPPGFRVGTVEPEAFTPLEIDPANPASTGSRAFESYGRLAPGVSLAAAQAEMTALESRLRQQYQFDDGMGVLVSDLHGFLVREARPALRLLMAVVVVVLAIACVNLAGLLMARGIARRAEFAVRVALGAGRGRLVRQLVIESLVLSFAGAVAGVAGAYWATRALVARSAGAFADSTAVSVHLDARVLLFTVVVATATALAFGLLPAWQASHIDPQSVLREQTRRATAGRRQFRIRELLVVSEVALAVVLLVGAGLLLRSFASLVRVKLGYQPSGALTMGLFLGVQPPEVRSALLDRILDRVESVPGVKVAGTIQFLPLRGLNCGTGFWLGEQGSREPSRSLFTECSLVSRGYFAAMGIPVVEGRAFDRQDRMDGPRVVVVNQTFVKRYYPDGRPLGRKIIVQWNDEVPSEIVGVVGDVHHDGLTADPQPTVFLLHAQAPGYITNLVVRTTTDPLAEKAAIIRAIQEIDPTQGVSNVGLIEQDVAKVLARPRLEAGLVTSFAVVAVLLAVIGIYGLIAYVVRLRTHEIGIRLALGATRERIFMQLFGKGAQLVVIGLVAGLVTAVLLRRIAATFVFGITAGDLVTYIGATLTFFVVAFAAIGIPARRAARVEPITALHLD